MNEPRHESLQRHGVYLQGIAESIVAMRCEVAGDETKVRIKIWKVFGFHATWLGFCPGSTRELPMVLNWKKEKTSGQICVWSKHSSSNMKTHAWCKGR